VLLSGYRERFGCCENAHLQQVLARALAGYLHELGRGRPPRRGAAALRQVVLAVADGRLQLLHALAAQYLLWDVSVPPPGLNGKVVSFFLGSALSSALDGALIHSLAL
jgi:hypothetical protein